MSFTPKMPKPNHKEANKLREQLVKPVLLEALRNYSNSPSANVKITAVADAGETIRLVIENAKVFDVIIKVSPWENPNHIYM